MCWNHEPLVAHNVSVFIDRVFRGNYGQIGSLVCWPSRTGFLIKREDSYTTKHREKVMWRHREKTTIYKSRRNQSCSGFRHCWHSGGIVLCSGDCPYRMLSSIPSFHLSCCDNQKGLYISPSVLWRATLLPVETTAQNKVNMSVLV